MSYPRTLAPLGAAVLLSLVLAGCGGDDALTAKEFRAQANKICKAADKDTDKLGDELGDSPSEKEFLAQIDKLVDRNEEMVDDLAALKAPESLSDDLDDLVSEVRSALKKVDDASLEEINSMENPFTAANEKAEELKLDDCADD